jgi:oligosaccharide repeat unit polymerase
LGSKKSILLFLVALSAVCFVLEIAKVGYIPIFHLFDKRDVYAEINASAIHFLHYFVMLSAILPSWAYIYYKRSAITRAGCIAICIITIFISCNFLSRQVLLLFSVSTFLTFNYYHRFSLSKKIAFGLFCIIIFLLVGAARLSQVSEAGHSDYLRAMGNIEYETNLAEGWLVSYAAAPFSYFDQLVEQNESNGRYYFGKYIFRPLLSLLFLEKLGVIKYESDVVGVGGFTYAMEPYLDLHLFGAIIFNIIIGFYAMHIFRRYNNCNDDAIVTWAIIVFCLIMTPFVNFFCTFFICLIWFINQILTSFDARDRENARANALSANNISPFAEGR